MHLACAKRHLLRLGGAFLILLITWAPQQVTALPPEQGADDLARVERILNEMSTPQKVAQLFMTSLWGEVLTLEGAEFLTDYAPGGVILFGYNTGSPEQITRLTNDIQSTIIAQPGAVPTWIAIDQEGGTVARLSDAINFTSFPVAMAVAATDNAGYARAIGAAMAEELRAVGINMNLAPVADVETNPTNPAISRRAFSADPQLTAVMVRGFIEGLQAGGVMATAKHFPGHGDTGSDSHLELPIVHASRYRLDTVELVPFREAITVDVGTVMVAHIWYPELDPVEDTPASLSGPVIQGLLRQELGFDGLVMTDALDMDAIDQRYTLAEAAKQAILAGADLITPGPHVSIATQRRAVDFIVQAVENGEIPLARIEDSVRRILVQKARFGNLDWSPLDPQTATTRINREAHEQLVSEVLAHAITLVYDNMEAIPLDPARNIALIYPATLPSIARHCDGYDPDLWLVGVSAGPTEQEIAWAASAAQWADTIIVFTIDAHLNGALQRLVRQLPADRTLVVALRSPTDWLSFPEVSGYLLTYTPLPAAIQAACESLFGAQPISGKLPVNIGEVWLSGTGIQSPSP